MKKNITLLLTYLSLILFACGGQEPEAKSEEPAVSEETKRFQETQQAIVESDPLADLHFQEDGSKWPVNDATEAGMKKIQSLLDNFKGDDLVTLGTEIKDELDFIISQCDMTGEAHEQYHIVLHALLKDSKALKNGELSDLENLKYCTYTYFEYFELPE